MEIEKSNLTSYSSSERDRLYAYSPSDDKGFIKASEALSKRTYPRDALYENLLQYNKEIGSITEKTSQNIEKIKNPLSFSIVGGQQVGLLGGPLYTFFKAISCLLTARQFQAIPIFWIASEDHDIREIDHAIFLDEKGNLLEKRLTFKEKGVFVEDLVLRKEHLDLIKECLELIKRPNLITFFSEGAFFSKAMASFFAESFKEEGLVFIEPAKIRHLALDLFLAEIERFEEVEELFQTIEKKFLSMNLPYPLNQRKVGETHLFFKEENHKRVRIVFESGLFKIGERKFSKKELLDFIRENSDKISPDVALRPLVQCMIFPTAAQIVGPSELEYWSALKPYFEFHQLTMPWLIPRLSITLVPKSAAKELSPDVSHSLNLLIRGETAALKDLKPTLSKFQQHALQNLFHPKLNLQERTYNFFEFQKDLPENLIPELLKALPWRENHHLYGIL